MAFLGNAHKLKKELGPAYGKRCNKCGKDNHFATRCQQKSSQQKKVNTVEESSEDDVYVLHKVSLVQSGADRFVTLRLRKVGTFHEVSVGYRCRVQCGTLKLYKEATGDVLLQNVIPSNDHHCSIWRFQNEVSWPGSTSLPGAHCVAIWLMLKFAQCWDGRLV